jgi:hypothetical protein
MSDGGRRALPARIQSIPCGQRGFVRETPHDCPSEVDEKQLEELHLAIVKKAD